MNDHDDHDELRDVMDVIRRVRPDDLASARTPAAQALLEEILSMEATQTRTRRDEADEAEADGDAPIPSAAARRSRRPYVLVGGIAAAVLAAVAIAGGVVGSPGGPSRADAVEAALAQSSSALERSGRAEVTWRHDWDDDAIGVESGVDAWEYSGEDSSVTIDVASSQDSERPINRWVDGEVYFYIPDDDGTYRWFHDTEPGDLAEGFALDPSTLLDELQPAGGFEEVGHEPIDGVDTTRLRAVDPEQTPVPDLDGVIGDTVTSLEVWVDDDGLVRRIDLRTTEEHPTPGDLALRSGSLSIVFSDLGEPITIEAPTDFEDINPV